MTTSKLEATTAYSALELLKRDLKRLSWLMRAVSIELPQLSRSADAVLKSGSELRFDENQIEIVRNNELPKQSPEAGFQEDFLNESYASLQRFLKDAFELQCSLEKTFANLPEEITSKLPAKDGSPWRAYYVRECLDLIRLWPKDVYVAVPYLEPEINIYDLCSITSPTRRGPSFALHERFKRFELLLNDAVDDISSLRFDFSPKVPKSDGCANVAVAGNASSLAEEQEEKRTYKAEPDTVKVIRFLEKNKSNEEIFELIAEDETMSGKSILAIRKIRSRWSLGQFIV